VPTPPQPTLSVGLPVFNGARYLDAAIASILGQDYEEFELVISDNASTDDTERICRRHAAQDARVRYIRCAENVGGTANFNRVFELSTGRYFKWIAHDDLHEPTFLSACVGVLERDETAAVVFARAISIDAEGTVVRPAWGADPDLGAPEPHVRFAAALRPPTDPIPLPMFGVMRSSILRKASTGLQGGLPDADRALVAEVVLHGRCVEIERPLFLHREHGERAGHQLSRSPYEAPTWWTGRGTAPVQLPHWRLAARHLASVRRAALPPKVGAGCAFAVGRWAWRHRVQLLRDFALSRPENAPFAATLRRLDQTISVWRWRYRTRRVQQVLEATVPDGATAVLVDGGELNFVASGARTVLPFIERDGRYWGPPKDGEDAVNNLGRLRAKGAAYFIVAWPAFWWLDYYTDLAKYLRAHATPVVADGAIKVFAFRDGRRAADEG
jgi:hypothetical protein